MTKDEIDDLITTAQSDDVQTKLRPGFQTGFISGVVDQWNRTHNLSDRQIEILEDIVQRFIPSKKPSNFSKRRYEGM
jgi:hypothetical protein